MSTETILLYAIGVFVLMAIGMVLTMFEFNRINDESSQRQESAEDNDAIPSQEREARPRTPRKVELRAVQGGMRKTA